MAATFICDEDSRVIEIPQYSVKKDEVEMKVRNLQVKIMSDIIRKLFKHSQPAFTCLTLTIETLEQGMKYQKDTRTTSLTYSRLVLGFLLFTWNM